MWIIKPLLKSEHEGVSEDHDPAPHDVSVHHLFTRPWLIQMTLTTVQHDNEPTVYLRNTKLGLTFVLARHLRHMAGTTHNPPTTDETKQGMMQ